MKRELFSFPCYNPEDHKFYRKVGQITREK